jgi:eukaryotic-like serine/threonine-protein kinase
MTQTQQTVGKYRLEETLRTGKTGQAYRARDTTQTSDTPVALKVLKPGGRFDPAFQTLFFSELEAVSDLEHGNIARVLDFGEDGVRYFVVSEWVPDGSLNTWLQRETRDAARPERSLALELMRQAAEALSYAHRKGVVHGQLEPENMLLTRIGSGYALKLSDFALSRLIASSGAEDATLPNEARYVSPEHVMGLSVASPSDVYSLGVVMYHAFTGLVPFQVRDLGEAAIKHVYEQPRALRELDRDIPGELETLVLRCLNKRPSERPTAEEVRDGLQGVIERYYPSVKSTRILKGGERVSQSPQISAPDGRCDYPRISVVDGLGQVLMVRELPPSGLTVGRQDNNTIVLDSDTVSRHHLRLEFDGREVMVTDLSSNGTFLIGGGLESGRLPFQEPTPFPWRGILQVSPYWIRLEQPTGMAEPGRLAVSVERDRLELTPGVGVPIRLTVANLGVLVDHLTFEVDGVPKEWVTTPHDAVQLNPGTQSTALLSVTAPREASSRARDYRVAVRARSRQNPEEYGEAFATWTVLPFAETSLQLRPGNRSARRKAAFTAVLKNNGNTPVTLQLSAHDDTGKLFCAFDESKPKPKLPPGARGVLIRWGQMLAYPFILVWRTALESLVGPWLRRAAVIQRDASALVGQDDEGKPDTRRRTVEEPTNPPSAPITIEPGDSAPVILNAWVPWRIVGRTLQRSFNVTAETLSLEDRWKDRSNLLREARPQQTNGQISHLALLPIWVPPVIALILALLGFLFIRNPSLERLRTVPAQVKAGQGFALRCDASSAVRFELLLDGNRSIPAKSCVFPKLTGIQTAKTYTVRAYNLLPWFGFGRATKDLVVTPLRDPKPAALEKFFVIGGSTTLDIGEGQKRNLQLNCVGKNIVRLELESPTSTQTYASCEDLARETITFDEPGDYRFKLQAVGEANTAQPLARNLNIRVRAVAPNINFSANPSSVVKGEGGDISLTWQVSNTSSVEISDIGVVSSSGSQSLPAPSETKTYTLSARSFGQEVRRSVTIRVTEAPPPPPPPSPVAVTPPPRPQSGNPPPPPRPRPTPPSGVGIVTPRPQPAPPQAPGEVFTRYFTNFGWLEVGNMNRIRYQDYIYDLSSSGLEIEASDNQIQGEIEGGGRLFLEFGAGRNTFDGSTRLNGRWCGAKPGVEFPDGCSFAGKWKVWINGKTCDMEMNRIGNRVSGSLCTGENRRVFKSSEDISFNGNVSRLIAEFETNPEFKNFTITITGYDGNQFKGSIASVASNRSPQWCGWRENQPKPQDCGR